MIGRTAHTSTYDPSRDRMLVFGGIGKLVMLNDVWALPMAGDATWTQVATAGDPPSGRAGHTTILDPARDRLVIFGGCSDDPDGEIWMLSLGRTPTWSHFLPEGPAPEMRQGHTAIYDPLRDRMLVFGGCRGLEGNLGDLWSLSLHGRPAWTQVRTAGISPGPLAAHSAIYDPVRDRMLVFGGTTGRVSPPNLDVWALSLGVNPTWSRVATNGTSPGASYGHAAEYDPIRDRMIVIRGGVPMQAWALSLHTLEWSSIDAAGSPNPRDGVSAIYDRHRDRFVMFGNDSEGELDDVWSLSLAPRPAWTALRPVRSFPQMGFGGFAMAAVFDDATRQLVLGSPDLAWTYAPDREGEWKQLAPSGTPPPSGRSGSTAIYDPVRHRVLVFGGFTNGTLTGQEDVWSLSVTPPVAWQKLTPLGTPPPGREGPLVVYDPQRDRALFFGGAGQTYMNDLWELSLGPVPAWHPLAAATPPRGRGFPSGAYDPVRDRLLVYGGNSIPYDDNAWALPLSGGALAWQPVAPAGPQPFGGYFFGVASYDAVADRMLLYDGELWELSLGSNPAWRQLHPAGGGYSMGMVAFDAQRRRLILPPWSLAIGASARSTVAGVAMGEAGPNPFRDVLTIAFTVAHPGQTTVRIYDVAGRIVRTLFDGVLAPGAQSVRWDSRDRNGARARVGLYFVEVRTAGQTATRKVTLID